MNEARTKSCKTRIRVAALRQDLWDSIWRPGIQTRWLGGGSRVGLRAGALGVLCDEAGAQRNSLTVGVKSGFELKLHIDPGARWGSQVATEATLRLTGNGGWCDGIEVEERGVPAAHLQEVERSWTFRLQHLGSLLGDAARRRKSVRQAVVVIHGIGEQQPGETLQNLVDSGVLTNGEATTSWVKPDRVLESYELRRVTLKASRQRPRTDVFEFYWAHMLRDTTLEHVASWLRSLVFRWHMPGPLRPLWLFCWSVILAIAIAAIGAILGAEWPSQWLLRGSVLAVTGSLAWRFIGRALTVNVIGDAARYLTPSPDNIRHRESIRREGVSLLRRLHECGRYDRIVVLGHSLGSVIAYDVITHAWAEMNLRHQDPGAPSFSGVRMVERRLDDTDLGSPPDIQREAWCTIRRNTQPWLVTDLVTVGSPLTYADVLMARSKEAFGKAIANRTLPTCPPVPEIESEHRRLSYECPYPDPLSGKTRTFTVFHHAAPFAVTRWTNLYFTVSRLGTKGDLVGGPLQPLFGSWVTDVPLDSPTAGIAHTWYWRRAKDPNRHLDQLRSALDLELRSTLRSLSNEMPTFVLLDAEDEDRASSK